ncbi:hypothetical protein V8E36_000874 [Tilletia maclaganii]
MFSPRSPLMRTKELLLDGGWRRSPHPDSGSERGLDDSEDDEGCFLQDDDEEPFAFFADCPPELTVHIFRHLPDVRDLLAVSGVCRSWYGLVRQYNGLWQIMYMQMPGWSIRPDTRVVLGRYARELADMQREEHDRLAAAAAAAAAAAGALGIQAGSQQTLGQQNQVSQQQHTSSIWGSSSSGSASASTERQQLQPGVAPLPYINLAPAPLSTLCRPRGRKSWIAAHLPDLSSLSLVGVSSSRGRHPSQLHGGSATASSSRTSSHSRNSSWDLASSVRSRVLSGAASMAQSASDQLQGKRRKSVHVDASPKDGAENSDSLWQWRTSMSLSRTLPTSPSPLRLQLAEEEHSGRSDSRSSASNRARSVDTTRAKSPQISTVQRALDEHERLKKFVPRNRNRDHFEDLDWRRLCMARWALDRRWGIPIPPRRAEEPITPFRMSSRTSSIGNDDDVYRPASTYLKGHTSTIYCIRMDSASFEGAGRVVSGSRDRTVKVWNRSTGDCVHTLVGHSGSVLCLQYDDELLVTGSSDHTIMVWDFTCGLSRRKSLAAYAKPAEATQDTEPYVIMRLQGHTDSVLNIAMNETYIVSCGKENMVRVWDRATGDRLRQFAEHGTAVNGIALLQNWAVSASGDPMYYVWDLETGATLQRVTTDQNEGLACVVAQSDVIATGGRPTIKIWDANTGVCRQTLNRHTKMVRSLAYDARRSLLVSGGYDFLVFCWYLPELAGSGYSSPSQPGVISPEEGLSTPRTRSIPPTPRQGSSAALQAFTSAVTDAPFLTPAGASSSSLPTPTSTSPIPFPRAGAAQHHHTSSLFLAGLVEPEPIAEFRDHSGRILSLALDGTHLVSASDDKRICVRNFAVALPSDPFCSVDLEIVGGGDEMCS